MPPLTLGTIIYEVNEDNGKPLVLSPTALSLPLYLLGKPNMGKSTTMLHLINQYIELGLGFVLIEPDNFLIDQVLRLIPPERLEDVILIDYGDHNFPIPNNAVDGYHTPEYEELRPKIVESLMAITRKLWADNFSTARMSLVFEHTYYTLLENPDTTLLSATKLFTDTTYRNQLIANVKNPHTRDFWHDYNGRKPNQRKEIGDPITFRLQQLYANPHLAHILCQPTNTIDLEAHIQNGGIILANLNRTHNDEAIKTLGALLFARLYHTVRHLGTTANPTTFFLDDFTEYVLPVLPTTFSQTPQMRFVMAHQFSGQLDDYPTLQKAIRANTGTSVIFQVGYHDATIFDQELGIQRDGSDMTTPLLTHLPPNTAVVKTVDHVATSVHDTNHFNMHTYPPPKPQWDYADDIIHNSRINYAVPKSVIKKQIDNWYRPWGNLEAVSEN